MLGVTIRFDTYHNADDNLVGAAFRFERVFDMCDVLVGVDGGDRLANQNAVGLLFVCCWVFYSCAVGVNRPATHDR